MATLGNTYFSGSGDVIIRLQEIMAISMNGSHYGPSPEIHF